MLLRSADPASSTLRAAAQVDKTSLMLQGYMLLLAVVWTTVTAYLQVSVVNCYRSYKLSRTLPLVSLQELEDASV